MSNEIMQENIPFVECSAFHRGMSVLEASLRNTEDSEAIISGLLKGAAEFYGASRASVVEADWDLGIGVITYEWCKDAVVHALFFDECSERELEEMMGIHRMTIHNRKIRILQKLKKMLR